MLKVLVIDDEPAARAGLAAMVGSDSDVGEVLECGDRDAGVRAIRSQRPDIVLLDVQLSPGTGFEIIDAIGAAMPPVVFVTAFDQFALKAFEAAAVDYVVKPVDPERLRVALAWAKTRLAFVIPVGARGRPVAVKALPPQATRPIAVADGVRTLLFDPGEVSWIEAADYYARIHARGRAWLVRETLDALEQRLARPPFFRIHRSAIVNVCFVTELVRVSRYRHVAVLRDGSRAPVSADRRGALEAWFSNTF